MIITKETLIEKINEKDYGYFEELYYGDTDQETRDEYEVVYDENWGDGNDYIFALKFKNLNLFVVQEGTYSSWDSPYWDNVAFAEPYEYTETRYKPVSYSEIRDKQINNILED